MSWLDAGFDLFGEHILWTDLVGNVLAIAGGVEDALIEAGVKPLRREGRSEGRWVLLDFGDLVVHVFHQEDRQYYSLERLWKDAPVIPIDLGAPQASVEHSEV